MRRLLILSLVTIVTASSTGCSSCGRPFMRWFNRGDSCRTCADGSCGDHTVHDDGSPGLLGSPLMHEDIPAPRGSGIYPGPAAVSPLPNPR